MLSKINQDKIKQKLADKIISWEEPNSKRIYFTVNKKDIFETVKFLFKDIAFRFSTASGMQTPGGFEILYHFSSDKTGEIYSVRVLIDEKSNPEIDSVTPLFSGAEWIEREMWELLGINFKGHPNLKRLLLDDDWPQDDYPLRKQK